MPAVVEAHRADAPLPTDPLGMLIAWQFDVPMILGFALAAWAHFAATRLVNRAHRSNRWPMRRTVAFLVAIAAPAIGLLSAIDALSDDLLTVHMIQHLLLVAVAAPLLASKWDRDTGSSIGTLSGWLKAHGQDSCLPSG